MDIDTTKHNIIITLDSDDVGEIMAQGEGNIYTGLKMHGKEIIIDYIACVECQEELINRRKVLKKEDREV